MDSLMKFMYKGEVDVKRDLLLDFMKTAQALKIKGLADDNYSLKPGNQQQQPAQLARQEAVQGAIQYQSSHVNRNEGPAIAHQNQMAAAHQERSMNENRIGLSAHSMSNRMNINPYAIKNFNDGDRGYGLTKYYESDGNYKNVSSYEEQAPENGSNNGVPNAKRPKLEPNGMVWKHIF